jgi:hypothetical protein
MLQTSKIFGNSENTFLLDWEKQLLPQEMAHSTGGNIKDERATIEALLFGEPGDAVPAVEATDIKAMWKVGKELSAEHPEGSVGISAEIWVRVCSSGADIWAVSFRCGMLSLLEDMIRHVERRRTKRARFQGRVEDGLTWMAVGVVHKGVLFDVEEFFAQARTEGD